MVKKIYYTWKMFDNDTKQIVQLIKQRNWNIKSIYGVPKGGLPLAVCLCNALKIPLVNEIGPNTLVVDDISDSGYTLLELETKYITRYITLFIRKTTKFKPSYHCREVDKEWVVFPWEPKTKKAKRDGTKKL